MKSGEKRRQNIDLLNSLLAFNISAEVSFAYGNKSGILK